jgi:hypothetical protein
MYTLRSLMILAALVGSTALRAADVKWDDLCVAAHSRALSIAAKDGVKVHGTCAYQTDHGITLNAGGGLRTVARDDIDTVRLDKRRKTHCLAKVGIVALASFGYGIGSLVTPYFFVSPVLIAGAPAILVTGPPFCAVYDLVNRLTGSHKITII